MGARIGIIGASHVGAHVADVLLARGIAEEVRLCDLDEKLSRAQANDLVDAASYYQRSARVVDCGTRYEELASCGVIVNAAGHVAASATSRDGELKVTPAEVRTFAHRIAEAGFEGVWVSAANPCDVVAYALWRELDCDPHRIVGSGTALDSARLHHALADATGYDQHVINSWMLGEHGFSEFACWSHVSVGCLALDEVEAQAHLTLDRAAIEQDACKGGYITMAGKLCTEYSISNAVGDIVDAIVRDAKIVTPVSTLVEDVYGVSGIFSSLPCTVGAAGVEQVFVPEFSASEIEGWHRSCAHIKENIGQLDWL
ncbi:lactate/malate family dehydrogenase [Thermophilibacter immobilis]|jgi:L-lactate dehydrogenase|uniref:L-lactate dehydrogenase n=1 Tax=Thermophilibacter immobilis TaxID=2779519 RepID=A0A7S7RTY6_9ACTN|nr:L-lactate dehydrogenase [Thermophilibacter immobilis]QOY60691.1 L-lactate dehydrogenase [Thermophilibacter immobilis]